MATFIMIYEFKSSFTMSGHLGGSFIKRSITSPTWYLAFALPYHNRKHHDGA